MRDKEIIINIEKGWSTHMPVLIKLVNMTIGPIMELGSGVYSTPLLHWLCDETKRELITYEKDANFIKFAKEYESEKHKVILIDDFLTIPNTGKYSIIFIDYTGHTRGIVAIHFKDSADYIIIHDSNVVRNNRLNITSSDFKYRKDYDRHIPWTTVFSNVKTLDNLW